MSADPVKTPLKALIVEDSEFDARIIVNSLRQGGYAPKVTRVETPETLQEALRNEVWEVVISDYNLPDFNALDALKIVQASGLDLPFIIVSGGIGEATAVDAMKAGAHDYIMKGNQARLCPAVQREMREAAERQARRKAEASSRESERRYALLWQTAADAILMITPDGLIEFANPATRAVFGYAPEELQGRTLDSIQPPSSTSSAPTRLLQFLREAPASRESRTLETLAQHRDGRTIQIEVSAGAMELHEKHWFVVFIRDVTQRKQAEKTLLENAEQFRAAREIQERLFPKEAVSMPGFEVAGMSIPAAAAGGDYFDFIPMLENRTGVVVADVSGHGVGPALLMAETRAYLRILARNREDLGEIFTRANMMLSQDLAPDQFITLLLVCIDPSRRSLVYANAGHPSGFVIGQDGTVRAQLKRTGVPLGMHGKTTYKEAAELPLLEGDTLIIFTDGVEEAINPREEFFERERVVESVSRNRMLPAKQIVDRLYAEVQAFAEGEPLQDDFTAIVVKVGAANTAS